MCHSLKILLNMQLGTAHRPFPTVKFLNIHLRGRLIHFETAPCFTVLIPYLAAQKAPFPYGRKQADNKQPKFRAFPAKS